MWVYHNLFICLPVDGYLSCFQCWLLLWTFVNKLLSRQIFSFLLGQYLRIEWLSHLVGTCLTFYEVVQLFSNQHPVRFHALYLFVTALLSLLIENIPPLLKNTSWGMNHIQYILYNSIHIKFWEIQTNLWWEKADQQFPGDGAEGEWKKGCIPQVSEETSNVMVHASFDRGDGFTVVHMCKLTESYTLNMCSFVYQLCLNKVKSSLNKCEGA